MGDPLVSLARKTIKHYLKTKRVMGLPADLPREILNNRAGVFVSLHTRSDKSLRGCIGTFAPTRKNVAQEVIANSIAAATQDPRFPPVALQELPLVEIKVDVLSRPKLVKRNFKLTQSSPSILDPKKYGLIVSSRSGRRGLLLPDISGVDSVQEQIEICYRKAGIHPKETVTLKTFTVKRHHE